MKKYLLVLLGLFVLTTTTYSQELTEKEKARKEKEAKKAHQGLMRIPALTFN